MSGFQGDYARPGAVVVSAEGIDCITSAVGSGSRGLGSPLSGTTTGLPVVNNVGGGRGSRAQRADNICSTERGCGKRVGRGSRRKREQPGQWWRHW